VQLRSTSLDEWLLECIGDLFASLASDSPAQQALIAAGAPAALTDVLGGGFNSAALEAAEKALSALGCGSSSGASPR